MVCSVAPQVGGRAHALSAAAQSRLEAQGFVGLDLRRLVEVAPWLRFAPGLYAALLGLGALLASPPFMGALALVATCGAVMRAHPFDLLYNDVLRYLTVTHPLPHQGAPRRFAWGVIALMTMAAGWALGSGHALYGYVLAGAVFAETCRWALTHYSLLSSFHALLFGRAREDGGHEVITAESPFDHH
jgi:hypothetical protein